MEIQGKTALVTGGAGGIGLACVKELLRQGAQVAVCDVDEQKGSAIIVELVNEFGPNRVIFIKTDVTNAQDFEEAFKTAIKNFKTLDIVLNNAGICDLLNWEKTVAVNLNGVIIGTNLAFKYMGKNSGGRGGVVCNTASVAGIEPTYTMAVYCATKHAVVGLTRSYGMSYYLDRTGVRVVAMCPGLTDSPMVDDIKNTKEKDEVLNHLSKLLGSLTLQKAANVATGMMVLLRSAENGSIWVCRGGKPVYQLDIPNVEAMRKTV